MTIKDSKRCPFNWLSPSRKEKISAIFRIKCIFLSCVKTELKGMRDVWDVWQPVGALYGKIICHGAQNTLGKCLENIFLLHVSDNCYHKKIISNGAYTLLFAPNTQTKQSTTSLSLSLSLFLSLSLSLSLTHTHTQRERERERERAREREKLTRIISNYYSLLRFINLFSKWWHKKCKILMGIKLTIQYWVYGRIFTSDNEDTHHFGVENTIMNIKTFTNN